MGHRGMAQNAAGATQIRLTEFTGLTDQGSVVIVPKRGTKRVWRGEPGSLGSGQRTRKIRIRLAGYASHGFTEI